MTIPEITEAVHSWIREDAPITIKMRMEPEHVAALVRRLAALRAPADGGSADTDHPCPYCGAPDGASSYGPSERPHDGNRMTPADLVDAALTVYLRPDGATSAPPWRSACSERAQAAMERRMGRAVGVVVRNLRYRGPDGGGSADAEVMRERAVALCEEEARDQHDLALAKVEDDPLGSATAYGAVEAAQTLAEAIRALSTDTTPPGSPDADGAEGRR